MPHAINTRIKVTKLRIGGKFKMRIKIRKGRVTISIADTTMSQNHLSFKIQLIKNPRNVT